MATAASLEVDASPYLTSVETAAYTGWPAEIFAALIRDRLLEAVPGSPAAAPLYPRFVIDALLENQASRDRLGLFYKYCYFIGTLRGPVKIGITVCPLTRLKALQTCCPMPLRILATTPGDDRNEKGYHVRFRHARIQGEWFRRVPEIVDEIRRINRENGRARIPMAYSKPLILDTGTKHENVGM